MKASFIIARPHQTLWLILATLFWVGLDRSITLLAQSPPERMTYQGFLVGSDGIPLANNAPKNYELEFQVFAEESGGVALWGEKQTATVDKGYFSVLLGEGTDLSGIPHGALSDLFKGALSSSRYISISANFGSVDLIQPRLRFLTSPYAFISKHSRTLVSDTGVELITASGSQLSFAGNLSAKTLTATNFTGNGAAITNINAANISSGAIAVDRIPSLNASKITAGAFSVDRIPDLNANKITAGTFGVDRIPGLDSSKITTGILDAARIPALDANKITTGTLDSARLNTDIARRNATNTFSTVTVDNILAAVGRPGQPAKGHAFVGDSDTGIFSEQGGHIDLFGDNSHLAEFSDDSRIRIFGIHAGTGTAIVMDSNSKLVKQSSSRRYKTNIVELKDDFARILKLEPKRYSRLESTNVTEVGYIAEDLHALGLTDLVYYDNERRPDSIHYAQITIYLNEVAKAQQREIAELRNSNNKQAEKLAQQDEDLKVLRSRFGELEGLVRRVLAGRDADPDREVAVKTR